MPKSYASFPLRPCTCREDFNIVLQSIKKGVADVFCSCFVKHYSLLWMAPPQSRVART